MLRTGPRRLPAGGPRGARPPRSPTATRTKILRECQDGRLTGDYTSRQIRDARNNIPDDIDQYSDCRDVLRGALLNQAGNSGNNGGGGGGGGGGTGGGGAGGGTGGEPLTPSTDADRQALDGAATGGGQPLADRRPPRDPRARPRCATPCRRR